MSKTVAQKLLVRPGMSVWVSDPDKLETLGPLPEDTRQSDFLAGADVAVVFVESEASARSALATHRAHLTSPKTLWIAYPKGNKADINRDSLWPIVAEEGLRPIGQVAVDEKWSALRFRPLKEGEAQFDPGGDKTD